MSDDALLDDELEEEEEKDPLGDGLGLEEDTEDLLGGGELDEELDDEFEDEEEE